MLARTPDAPEGVKGISVFIVPKFLPGADGAPGPRNDVRCVSLEHKLGIHASPTAVLAFGDAGGAIGYCVGQENRGLEYMFTMMNVARLSVGLEGIGIAERAYQRALAYARDRVQGRAPGDRTGARASIIRHPDVRRMLIGMKARIDAMRAVAYNCAAALDQAHRDPDPAARAQHLQLVELLTPIVKGWSTEWSIQIASTALQVHGGMGFIEEAGAAQHYRDARITTIYEGTTGIQAADLVGRKILRDRGAVAGQLLRTMRELEPRLAARGEPVFAQLHQGLAQGIDALEDAVNWLLAQEDARLPLAAAGAVPGIGRHRAGRIRAGPGGPARARNACGGGRRAGFPDGEDPSGPILYRRHPVRRRGPGLRGQRRRGGRRRTAGQRVLSGGMTMAPRTIRLADITISHIVEWEHPFEDIRTFLPSLTAAQLDENRHWMQPWALDSRDRLIIALQSYVVRTPHHTILIDTCIGNAKPRPGRPLMHNRTDPGWMNGLAALGLGVEDIDVVMCTHLHVDHVGWNTRLQNGRWVSTFPNARYLFSAAEMAYWAAQNAADPIPHFIDSVLPVVQADQHALVRSDFVLDDHVRLLPTPGHTPDHYAVILGKGRDDAVMTGDLIHSPIEARYPELVMRADVDQALACQTRRAFLERYCDTSTLCCTAHFPSPSRVRITRWGEGFRCDPVD